MLRTHTCGQLRLEHVGQRVTLAGWVNRRRDHGGLVFLNLRDRDAITQVVFDPDAAPEAFQQVHEVGQEWVVGVSGLVRARPEGQANPDMATGDVEVVADELRILNRSKTPPFEVARELDVDEALRLKYRYLDLRRDRMRRNIMLRHAVTSYVREFLNDHDFAEVETPILIKSTPEGARDFLVPSRMHKGKFYALPQSPQQIKQLLMIAGLDRYYQLARCFRDEDQRADRQLEFTQLDIEMAFVDEDDVMSLTEALFIGLVQTVTPHFKVMRQPFPRLTYAQSMERFGTDQPDMRFELELVDLSRVAQTCGFRVFSSAVAAGGKVRAVAAPTAFTRREIDELEELVKERGAAGLAWLIFDTNGARGPVAKFLTEDEISAIEEALPEARPATALIVAGDGDVVAASLARLREEVATRLDMVPEDSLAFAWITDAPLVEWNADEDRWDSMHHPFTSPQERDLPLLDSEPSEVRARAYDVVCNGYELAGGSIRIHERAVQAQVFALLGISAQEAEEQFGHLLTAFEYGAPPHGGIAWGFDRVVMVLAGEDSIREVIAFPKTLSGVDLMTDSPSEPPVELLDDLGIRVRTPLPTAADTDRSDEQTAQDKEP